MAECCTSQLFNSSYELMMMTTTTIQCNQIDFMYYNNVFIFIESYVEQLILHFEWKYSNYYNFNILTNLVSGTVIKSIGPMKDCFFFLQQMHNAQC